MIEQMLNYEFDSFNIFDKLIVVCFISLGQLSYQELVDRWIMSPDKDRGHTISPLIYLVRTFANRGETSAEKS